MTFVQPTVPLSTWVTPQYPYSWGTDVIQLWDPHGFTVAVENFYGMATVPNPQLSVWVPVDKPLGSIYPRIPNRWIHGSTTYGFIDGTVVFPQ